MKKQFLFSVLAVSALFSSCNNEIEKVVEESKAEVEMSEVIGAKLISNGMSINLFGAESRAANGAWVEGDKLALAWYNVNTEGIEKSQTTTLWKNAMKAENWADKNIYANHKFTVQSNGDFTTESDVYEGAYFVYYPYARRAKVESKKVNVNELSFNASADESQNDINYDMANRAFMLSAQDWLTIDPDNADKLTHPFLLSPMVNALRLQATPAFAETAVALKNLNITKVSFEAGSAVFAQEWTIDPSKVPAVVRDTKTDEILSKETIAKLDAYACGITPTKHLKTISRILDKDFGLDLSERRDVNVFTLPTAAYAGKATALRFIVEAVSENGIKATFTIKTDEDETEINKAAIDKLQTRLGAKSTANPYSLQGIVRNNGSWTHTGFDVELTEDNVEITYAIANKDQWDDAVALAEELGEDATFTLIDDVVFTEDINLPEGIALTVVSNKGSMVIDGEISWPNTTELDLTAATVVVEDDAVLTIADGIEVSAEEVINEGVIKVGKLAKIEEVNNEDGRIEVVYGSYVEVEDDSEGVIAYEITGEEYAYQINYLIDPNNALGEAHVNTLVINEGIILDLNMKDIDTPAGTDPYNPTTQVTGESLNSLENMNIEMNNATIKGITKSVNNINVVSGTENKIVDVTINGDLMVENDAAVTVDATPTDGKKYTMYVEGDIINGGTINAEVEIITTDVLNEQYGKSTLNVADGITVWYTNNYKQGGTVNGNVLKKGLTPTDPGVTAEVVTTLAELTEALAGKKAYIAFGANIEGDFTIEQIEGYDIVIDGNDYMYTGQITIDGNARSNGNETLTFKNLNFVMTNNETKHQDFISCNFQGGDNAYAHNVTVENCTFTAEGTGDVVGMRFRQCYDITVKNCDAQGLHSLIWSSGCTNITVDGVNLINCKEGGIDFANTKGTAVIKNSKIHSVNETGYGVRGTADNIGVSLEINNCEFEANYPVLVRSLTTGNSYTLNLTGENTLTSTGTYHIVATAANSIKDELTLTNAQGSVTIKGDVSGMSIFK